MDRRAPKIIAIIGQQLDMRTRSGIVAARTKDMCELDASKHAIDRLQKICSELDGLHVELLKESDIETNALGVLRDSLDQMRTTAWTLQKGFEQSRLSPGKQDLFVLLTNVRMRLASQLNTALHRDLEAGRIRTDQDGLSVYLMVLNQVMEQLDRMFGSRKAAP
jgi:hypothetical protein